MTAMTLAAAVDAVLQGRMEPAEFRTHLDAFSGAMKEIQDSFNADIQTYAQRMPSDKRLMAKIQKFQAVCEAIDANVSKMKRFFQDGNCEHVRTAFEKINTAADEFAELSRELQGITGPDGA